MSDADVASAASVEFPRRFVASDADRQGYLNLLAEVSRLFTHDEVRDAVLSASTPAELLEVLRGAESR